MGLSRYVLRAAFRTLFMSVVLPFGAPAREAGAARLRRTRVRTGGRYLPYFFVPK
jgi:hypothetical protein